MSAKKEATSTGVSSRTQLNLKALLAEQQEQVARNKAAGQSRIEGGVKRPDKKPPKWMKPNPGVQGRAARDTELEEIPRATIDAGRAKLAQKVVTYGQLKRGKSGGLNDKQMQELLVDFDNKEDLYMSDSDDVDESLTVPVPPQAEDDDPVMEYEDEYGRTRTARRSEVPREYLRKLEEAPEDDIDPYRIANPVGWNPTYQRPEAEVQAIKQSFAEENNPIETHFDPTREIRSYGAGHYRFSQNADTRKEQQKSLAEGRKETLHNRDELHAPNVPVGASVGMQGEPESAKSRALEKRKRLLEERNKQLEAKRKKRKGQEAASSAPVAPTAGPSNVAPPPAAPAQDDPFAAMEAQTNKDSTQPVKQEVNAADDFLARLEQDVLLKQRAH